MKQQDSIWQKLSPQSGFLPKCLLIIGLQKQSKKSLQFLRFFKFYDEYILQYKDEQCEKYIGKLEFNFHLKVEWLFESKFSENEKPTPIVGMILKSGNKQIVYKSRTNQDMKQIYEFLKRKLNQCNISDFYKAIKKIGTGGFANVYILESRENGKQFASKTFIKAKLAEKDYGKSAVYQEINILRSLKHPHIIQLLEIFETENSYYMLTQLFKGDNLFKYIKSQKSLTEEQVAYWVHQLLPALQLMSHEGIMHRDIKPDNLMFEEQFDQNEYQKGNLILVDFGLATHAPLVYGKGELFVKCGTPGFVAPEICNLKEGEQYDVQCDVFSFGCVVHILMLSRPVFYSKVYNDMLKINKNCEID